MSPNFSTILYRRVAGVAVLLACLSCAGLAQEAAVVKPGLFVPDVAIEPVAPASVSAPESTTQHGFWDRENILLFAGVAGMSSADFSITNANIKSGGRELDPAARVFGTSTAGLATNFAAETAGVVGISYLFHKTGHHKLERMASVVNISASTFAVAYDLVHKTK
ncbi:MAG TPA: hypothetical protein VF753_12900 [Terriglobales bacterium]